MHRTHMEPSQYSFGAPAANSIPDESINNVSATNDPAKYTNSHLPPPGAGRFPTILHDELSPPQEPGHSYVGQAGNAHLQYSQGFDKVIPPRTGLDHPPTPPRQDDEFDLLRKWYMQDSAQEAYARNHAALPATVTMQPDANTIQHGHTNPHTLPQLSAMIRQWIPNASSLSTTQETSYSTANTYNQQLSPYQRPAQHQGMHGYQTQNNPTQLQNNVPHSRETCMQLNQANAYSKLLPDPRQLHVTAIQSPYQLPLATPAIKQWPTQSFSHSVATQLVLSHQHAPITSPSPGHDSRSPPDKIALQRKGAYHKKAEDLRRQQQASAIANTPQPGAHKPSTAGGRKRKLSNRITDVIMATMPPSIRPAHVPGYHPFQDQNYQPDIATEGSGHISPYVLNYGSDYFDTPPPISSPEPPPLPPIDWDRLPQAIVKDYQAYKWPVTLYEMDPHGQYGFAQSWLEDLFAMNLKSSDYRWCTHSTHGFIKDGTRFSFLVLHNAADPFEWGLAPDSTTTVGVYGAHWYDHEEIHWKTHAPGISWLLQWCSEQGCIQVKQKWTWDMPKASEKRFHRAYWLAANMRDLKDLLNHGSIQDKPHDVPEGEDEEFEVEEGDLTNEWDISKEESKEAWEKVLQENEENGESGRNGFQHVVTGCSEWE